MIARTDHLTNTPTQAAEYEARQGENREVREPVRHVHYWAKGAFGLACSCGETVGYEEAL